MRAGILIGFLGLLSLVCWALVLGHQLGWAPLQNPDRSDPLQAMMLIAYIWGGIAVAAVIAVAVVGWVSPPRPEEG